MGVIAKAIAGPAGGKRLTLNEAYTVLANANLGNISTSGITVTPDEALRMTAVLACTRVLAEDVASLPLFTYRRLPGRGKERATDHPLFDLLHNQPNPEQTSFIYRETSMVHACLWANTYSEIDRDDDGAIRALWPITPWRVEPHRDPLTKAVFYRIKLPDGGTEELLPWQVLHVPWLGLDGLTGLSPLKLAREAIGTGKAAETFAAMFFSEGAWPGLVVRHPKRLSQPAYDRLTDDLNKKHKGLSKAQRTIILEEAMDVTTVGMGPEVSQLVESREFGVEEIARFYRVQPHKIGHHKRSTFSNIEHLAIDHVVSAIRPWTVRWEQAYMQKLLLPDERKQYFVEHLIDGLLRGDSEAKWKSYTSGWQVGAFSANDILEMENRNGIGRQGDRHYVPLNFVSVEEEDVGNGGGRSGPGSRERRSATSRRKLGVAFQRVFEQAAARIVRREHNDVMASARKLLGAGSMNAFRDWLRDFYREHESFVRQQMEPVLMTYAEAIGEEATGEMGRSQDRQDDLPAELAVFMASYTDSFVDRWVGKSRGELTSVAAGAGAAGGDSVEALDARFLEWRETRPLKVARWETVQAGSAVVLFVGKSRGFSRKTWVTFGDNCPYCNDLDGRTIGIETHFLDQGTFQPEGASRPLTTGVVGHAPAHDGCDCSVVVSS